MAPAPEQAPRGADQREQHVEVQVAGLQAAHHPRRALRERGDSVQRAIDQRAVGELEEHVLGHPEQRAADDEVVELVDEVLPFTAPGAARRPDPTASARSPLPAKNHAAPTRPASPSATDITTMGMCAPAREGRMPGSGNIGSRKCGIDRKPPIAESTASITEHAGHRQRRLVDVGGGVRVQARWPRRTRARAGGTCRRRSSAR